MHILLPQLIINSWNVYFLGPPNLLNLSRNLTIAFDTSPEATSIFDIQSVFLWACLKLKMFICMI